MLLRIREKIRFVENATLNLQEFVSHIDFLTGTLFHKNTTIPNIITFRNIYGNDLFENLVIVDRISTPEIRPILQFQRARKSL